MFDSEWRDYETFTEFLEDMGEKLDALKARAKRADELENALRTLKEL